MYEGEGSPDWPEGSIAGISPPGGALIPLARQLWKVDSLQADYADFIERFGRFGEAVLSPADAIVARVVAVHRMRRIVLRDPGLPRSVLPADWAGEAAREIFTRLLTRLAEPSEAWLNVNKFRNGGLDPRIADAAAGRGLSAG